MKNWTEVIFKLENSDTLTVCEHSEYAASVSLSLPGFSGENGFAIYFTTGQIEAVEELLQELRDLKALEKRANRALLEDDLAA